MDTSATATGRVRQPQPGDVVPGVGTVLRVISPAPEVRDGHFGMTYAVVEVQNRHGGKEPAVIPVIDYGEVTPEWGTWKRGAKKGMARNPQEFQPA